MVKAVYVFSLLSMRHQHPICLLQASLQRHVLSALYRTSWRIHVHLLAISCGLRCHCCPQEMRTYKQCEEAGISVGFELMQSRDLSTASEACGPW